MRYLLIFFTCTSLLFGKFVLPLPMITNIDTIVLSMLITAIFQNGRGILLIPIGL